MAPTKSTRVSTRARSLLVKALKKNNSKEVVSDVPVQAETEPVKAETEHVKRKKKASTKNKAVDMEPVKNKKRKTKAVSEPVKTKAAPEPVKTKVVSASVQSKLSKKRKRVEEPAASKQEGLKLLKRGAVTMHKIVKRKIMGTKLSVPFNSKGEPYGAAGAEMQSYIGVLARSKPPICAHSWKDVPQHGKDKIWDCVKMAFEVPSTAKKLVLSSACHKWREFKSRLTRDYILPYRDQPELLQHPPADYSFIEKAHWDLFVQDRLSDGFSLSCSF